VEALIRAKYEQKKYIDKDWVPPRPSVSHFSQWCSLMTDFLLLLLLQVFTAYSLHVLCIPVVCTMTQCLYVTLLHAGTVLQQLNLPEIILLRVLQLKLTTENLDS